MTLDLGAAPAADPASDAVLSSPDVRLLKLASPELEKLVLQQYRHRRNQLQQQNSSKDTTVSHDAVSDDDRRGFVNVLLQVTDQRQNVTYHPVIRSTTQTSSLATRVIETSQGPGELLCQVAGAGSSVSVDTPPLSPQPGGEERARLERKRARNRDAATRCRNRKLERIDELQRQADRLRADNRKLTDELRQLRDTVGQLRRDVTLHAGCRLDSSVPTTHLMSL